jgi:glycosyltransferase involved in cell wall biosynthesis
LISELGSTDWVHWTGYVPDEDLRHLHSGATAVVLASESEGFGLPAVEGAACGAPVIATTESPLPQILAGAGIFVAPGSVDEIEAAMRLLLGSPETQRAMATQALVCASALSWSAAAKATSDALHEAAA